MIVSRIETGRRWGDRLRFKAIRSYHAPDGLRLVYEADFWEGPCLPGELGQYVRHRFDDTVSGALGNTSPTASHYSELKTAIGRLAR